MTYISTYGIIRDIQGKGCLMRSEKQTQARELSEADARFREWQRNYRAVEEAILAERDRRAESRRRRRGKAFGDLCEMTEGWASFCRRTGMPLKEVERRFSRRRPPQAALWLVYELGELAWAAASALRSELTRRIDRADHEAKRPFYYAKERKRRQALAAERRKVRMRHTLNPCPTKEAVLKAWTHVKDSPEALLRFGSLMEDLECYVDNSLRRTEDGVIVGRSPGIKGWLQTEIPALYLKYKTVMAYKAAAKRMRQVIDLSDPISLSAALPDGAARSCEADGEKKPEKKRRESRYGEGSILKDYGADESSATKPKMCGADELEAMRARAVYLEVMEQVGDGRRRQTALFARLNALTDPEAVDDANMLLRWKESYKRKITVRTKSIWERRLRWTG